MWFSLSTLELCLQTSNYTLVYLECLGQNIISNGRGWSKNSICNSDDTWVLAAQGGERNCLSSANVLLEVRKPHWKHKHISRTKHLWNEPVVRVGGHKPNKEFALLDCEYLSCARMSVWWNNTPWCIVYTGQGDAKGVQSRQLSYSDWSNPRAKGFDVFPGTWSPLKKKWLACTSLESKQARPLTRAAKSTKMRKNQTQSLRHYQYEENRSSKKLITLWKLKKAHYGENWEPSNGNRLMSKPELVGSATQKSCRGLGSKAMTRVKVTASKLNIIILWHAIFLIFLYGYQ